MPVLEAARRLLSTKAPRLLAVTLLIAAQPLLAQELGSTFALDEQQTAVAHVDFGQFVLVRLRDGARAGGPLIRATPLAVVVGPSVAFGDQNRVLSLRAVDTMWVRVYSTRRGLLVGAAVGALTGLAIGTGAASLCPDGGFAKAKPCAQQGITSAVTGTLLGGIIGSLVGAGRVHWRRLLPRSGEAPSLPNARSATLVAPDDSAAFDPRALALMRIPRASLVRLTFGDREDLAGYVTRAGARGASLPQWHRRYPA